MASGDKQAAARVQGQPGTLEAILLDRQLRVVAAGDPRLVAHVDNTPRLRKALRTGAGFVGHEADKRNQADFEFVQPIDLPGGRYILEIVDSGEFFDNQLSAIRADLALTGTVGIFVALGLFWLAGGRALLRTYSYALQRATLDGLTDLSNHRAFQSELEREAALAARAGEALALIMLDLDGFKLANDRHGHGYGDARLKHVAHVLASGRAGDQGFRIGGDEFALILPRTNAAGAALVVERVRTQLAELQIPVSLGVSELRSAHTPSDLREEADAALYEAKRLGGSQVAIFSEIAAGLSMTTTARTAALDALLAMGDLDVAFQPIWNLQQGSLLGVEALARPHPRHAFAGPADAFDAAQHLGRVHELDVLCVTSILQRASELPEDALLFINVSPQTLDRYTDPWLERLVADAGLDPARIVIEVTERVGGRIDLVIQTLRRLRDHGFAIAIDDVGTGNSGLQMLGDSHADYIKLDRSIVAGALTDPNARAILVAMAAYAHHTGAFVIAEGVEDQEVLELVMNLGSSASVVTISGGQGYGLGRPDTTPSEQSLRRRPKILDPRGAPSGTATSAVA